MRPGEDLPRLRVLVVEDNQDGAEMLSTLLAMFGHEPRIELDAEAGLRALSEFEPDVALLDIGLPAIDGYELARRIRGTPGFERLPLIAISGWGMEEDVRRAREAGFNHHLTKPAAPEELERLLLTIAAGSTGEHPAGS
jgi:CheY-like chemotaxis protein